MFGNPNSVQLAMLQRLAKVLTATSAQLEKYDEDNPEFKRAATEGLEAVAKVLDVFCSLAADDVQDWLIQMMLTGKLDQDAINQVLVDMTPVDEEDKKPKTPAKKARRAT